MSCFATLVFQVWDPVLMGLPVYTVLLSPRLGRQGITNVTGIKNRQYDYPRVLSPEPIHPTNPAKPYPLKISPVTAHDSKVSPSLALVATCGCPMHTEVRQLVCEFQVVRGLRRHPRHPRHLEIKPIVTGRDPQPHLRDLVAFPLDPHISKPPSFPLHLDPKYLGILTSHKPLIYPTTRAGNKHLPFRINRVFLGCHQQMAHRDF